jgi:DNA uptake protein ComE-like DNA-binding protein
MLSYTESDELSLEDNNEEINLFMQKQQHYQDSISAVRNQWNLDRNAAYGRKTGTKRRNFRLFHFDPDTMLFSDWQRLGFTDKEAQMIANYQNKGGKFREKEDMKRLYCVSDEDYQILDPYIHITSIQRSETKKDNVKATDYVKIELNSSDSLELQKVPNIGQKTATQIVLYREKLGGFIHIDQLMEVYIVDSSRFFRISPYVYVNPSNIKKININKADIKELAKHPYIDYYLAKSIVVHRQNNGNYKHVEELKSKLLLYEELYQKIKPYLCTE